MAHPDLDQLLNTLLPFAQQMLAKHGEFYPFGAHVNSCGELVLDAPGDVGEHPSSQVLIDLLTRGFRERASAGTLRAAGICCDIRTIPPGCDEHTDAICVSLEHENGESADLCVPYRKGWFGRISYAELFATRRDRAFYPQ